MTETVKGYVTAVGTTNIGSPAVKHVTATIQPLTDAGNTLDNVAAANNNVTGGLMVYGSEYAKGTTGRTTANKPQFKSFTNKPVIIKDMYEVSGSDASQIGWVEVTGEDGQNGYLWYLKAAGDTRARFTDYLEMVMIEHESATQTVNH